MVYSRSSYSSLPSKAGIYIFLDVDNAVLYVGKAKDLKARVSSYFTNSSLLGPKTKLLVSYIEKIRITIVESELEALLLEAFYIKKYKPKYNIRLMDNKSYLRIQITIKDPYPKVLLARKEADTKSLYFGPYPNAGAVRLVLKTIRKVFPFQSVPNHPKRICLYNHLGLCPCPPIFDSLELRKQYKKNIKSIIKMLEGESRKLMRDMERQRDAYSKKENYEEALMLQKKINALSIITAPFRRPFEYHVNPNLRSDIRQKELEELKNAINQSLAPSPYNLAPISNLSRIECYDISNIQGTNATGSMVVLTNGEIDKSQYRRFKIRRENKPNDFAMMQEVLTRRFKHDGWDMPDLIIVDGGKGQVSAALEVLHALGVNIPLIGLAKREETIIIPKNSNIKYRNSKQYQNTKNQISKRFENLNLENSIIVSNFGFRASDLTFVELSLPKNSPALHLIMRIRDEAHRFAITYHKKLRSKTNLA